MKAFRLIDWKSEPELVEVSKPMPAPGEVVIKIGGAGACHSDLHLMHDFEAGIMPWQMPFTLGQENAGWVDSIGSGVTTVSEGDAVAVYGAWGCGKCSRCQQGFENYFENPAEAPVFSGESNSPGPPPAPSVTPPSSASQAARFSCRSSRSPMRSASRPPTGVPSRAPRAARSGGPGPGARRVDDVPAGRRSPGLSRPAPGEGSRPRRGCALRWKGGHIEQPERRGR